MKVMDSWVCDVQSVNGWTKAQAFYVKIGSGRAVAPLDHCRTFYSLVIEVGCEYIYFFGFYISMFLPLRSDEFLLLHSHLGDYKKKKKLKTENSF